MNTKVVLVCLAHLWTLVVGQTKVKPVPTPVYPTPAPGWGLPTLWYKQQIPNPRQDPAKCGRGNHRSWVCDPNSILKPGEADNLDRQIETLRRTTGGCKCEKSKKCKGGLDYGGWQAGVAIITNMAALPYQPSSSEKLSEAAEFADYVRDESWELGVCNDDLVIFLSWNDRIVYTAIGDEMSSTVTDACVDKVTANAKPLLADDRPGDALSLMLDEYSEVLYGNHECKKGVGTTQIIIGAVLGAAAIVSVGACFIFRKRCPQVGGTSGRSHHYHAPNRRHSNTSVASKHSGGGGAEF